MRKKGALAVGRDAGDRVGAPASPNDATRTPSLKRLGDFDILGEIGRGGMGVVYEARQVSLKRRVALKVLPPALGMTPHSRQRFEREAQAAAKLHHTNIVPVHTIGEGEGHHYYAMDLIEGQSLDRVLHELVAEGSNALMDETVTRTASTVGPTSATPSSAESTTSLGDTSTGSRVWLDTVAKLVAEVADALGYAHGRGVIHRDIKPANLILSSEGKLCVTDFGLARIVQEPGMTVSGSFLGTPAYMSPEQIAAGRVKLDHRTDIYSLGAVLYELLTLRRPFVGECREEILSAIMAKDPRRPRKLNGKIPQDLETICLKTLEKDPDRRYATAAELAADLRQYLHGGLIAARRAGLLRRGWKTARRHPTVTVLILGMLVASAIGVVARHALSEKNKAEVARLVSEARLLMERGEYRPGLEKADRALALDADCVDARLVRARILLQRVHFSEAAGEARRVLRHDPGNWEAHLVLAVAAGTSVPTIDAQYHLAAVEGRVPDTADAFYLRGLVAESNREAVGWLDRALELNPAHARALLARGNRLIALKDFSSAMADAERLVAVRPRSAQGHRQMGHVLWEMHDPDKALASYERGIELDPEDPLTWFQRAWEHWRRGRIERALEGSTRAIELDPELVHAYDLRANTYANYMGEYEKAIADCRRALEINPSHSPAYGNLWWAYWQADRRDEAQAVLIELNARADGWYDREALAFARRVNTMFYRRLGDDESFLAEVEKIIDLRPHHIDGYLRRARARQRLEGESAVDEECDIIAGLQLDEPGQFLQRGNVMRDFCRRVDQGLSDYRRALDLAPSWADPYYARALLHEIDNERGSALRDMARAVELAPGWREAVEKLAHMRETNR